MRRVWWHWIGGLLACLTVSGAGSLPGPQPLKVYATVAPMAWLVEQIGGDQVEARAAIPGGRSPHDYQPTPQEVVAICGADLYLTADLWFEQQVVLPVLKNTKVPCRAIGGAIVRIPVADEEADEHDRGSGTDQHIWLSTANAVILCRDIAAVLTEFRPEQDAYFSARAEALIEQFRTLEDEERAALAPYAGRPFLVYHPAFRYLAREFALREVAIEHDGKMPTPRRVRELVALARENGIRTVLVQPQYNAAPARGVATVIGADVVSVDPLAADLLVNLRQILNVIKESFVR